MVAWIMRTAGIDAQGRKSARLMGSAAKGGVRRLRAASYPGGLCRLSPAGDRFGGWTAAGGRAYPSKQDGSPKGAVKGRGAGKPRKPLGRCRRPVEWRLAIPGASNNPTISPSGDFFPGKPGCSDPLVGPSGLTGQTDRSAVFRQDREKATGCRALVSGCHGLLPKRTTVGLWVTPSAGRWSKS